MRRLLSLFAVIALCVTASAQVPMTGAGLGKPGATTGSCSQSTSFISRSSITGSDLTNYDNLICGGVTDGWFTKCDAFYEFDAPNSTVANLNLVSSSYNITAHGSPSFTAYQGYTGTAASSTVYLDTGLNPTSVGGNFVQNSAALGIWVNNSIGTSVNIAIGANSGSTYAAISPYYTNSNIYAQINNASGGNFTANNTASTLGHWAGVRTGASASQIYHSGSNYASPNATSNGLINQNIYILATNNAGSAASGYGAQIAMAYVCSGLSSTDETNLHNRVTTYRTAVGGL